MTDIPFLIERLRVRAADLLRGEPLETDGDLMHEAAEALSLTVSPLPEEIAGLIGQLKDRVAYFDEHAKYVSNMGRPRTDNDSGRSAALCEKAAAALERMARENEELKGHGPGRTMRDQAIRIEAGRQRIRELEAERDKLKRELSVAVKFHEKDAADYEALMDERDAIKTKVSNLLDLLDQGGLPEEYQVARLDVASHVGYEPASDLQKRHDTEFVDAIKAKTIADCLNTTITVRGFGTASDDYLNGFHAGALAKTESIRALNQQKPETETE